MVPGTVSGHSGVLSCLFIPINLIYNSAATFAAVPFSLSQALFFFFI